MHNLRLLSLVLIFSAGLFFINRSDTAIEKNEKKQHSYNHDHSHNHDHSQHQVSLGNNTFCSISPYPESINLEQPDGSGFQAKLFTIGHAAYLETLDGYSIIQDANDQVFRYATRGKDGDLFQTAIAVTEINQRAQKTAALLEQIGKHLRYEGETLRKIETDYAAKANNDGVNAANPAAMVFPPTGIQKALLILIDYPDQPFTYPVANFENLANQVGYSANGAVGSFRDYWLDVSYGALTVNTDVVGWYTAANNRATYGVEDLQNRNFNNARALIREAVDAAEAAGIDFSLYDGDNDGKVDVVEVIHSGRGTEESGNIADIWSHRWVLGSQQVTYDGKLISDYIVQAETLGGNNNMANIGVLVHEFGHALSLPDLYYSGGAEIGLGRYCLMASGTWNNGGRTPAQLSAWCKEQLGWVTPIVLTGEGSISNMSYIENTGEVYRINSDLSNDYFLLENRQKLGWDTHLTGEGLGVYLIKGNTSNDVDLLEADGLEELNTGNGGDADDLYPGGTNNTTLDCTSMPSTAQTDGANTNIRIDNISMVGDLINFDYGYCSTACSMLGVNLNEPSAITNNQYDQSFEVSYSFPPSSGTLTVNVNGTIMNVPITGSPQTVTFTNLPADGQVVNVTAAFSEQSDCGLLLNNFYIAPIDHNNNAVCDAFDVTNYVGLGSFRCSNIGTNAETNEPRPVNADCGSQNSWCDGNLSKTIWYKFDAPASGSVDIDCITSIDLQLALWEANSCQDIFDANKRLMVAANDDSGSGGGFAPRLQNVTCLVPGKTYYLQVDGYNNTSGNFSLVITDPQTPCTVAPVSTGTCSNDYTGTSTGRGEWLHLKDGTGKVIVSVNDRFNDLGTLTSNYDINSGSIRTDADNHMLLQRDIFISAQNNNAAAIRLYLSDAEFTELINASTSTDLSTLELLKIAGGTCANPFNGTSEVVTSTDYKTTFDGVNHMIEFDISGFSSFMLRSNAAILPVDLAFFKGEVKEKDNLLLWETNTEKNTERFEIQRQLANTTTWETIGNRAAAGDSEVRQYYSMLDTSPQTLAYYRLKTIDYDGRVEYSDIIKLERESDAALQIISVYPNPIMDAAQVAFTLPEAQQVNWELHASDGRILSQSQLNRPSGDNLLVVPMQNLPAGCYYLKLNAGEQGIVKKLVKY